MLATFTPSLLLSAWFSGIATGLGLFMVVGAQSAFILKQGVMRTHLMPVLAVCAVTDFIMIFASVMVLQALVAWLPGLTSFIRWAGVLFLLWYGLQSARRAIWPQPAGKDAAQVRPGRGAAIAGALGFTLLNPHFWLDIVVVGSIAQSFTDARLAFAFGAATASAVWLSVLGLGSRLLAPLFTRPGAWRLLDAGVACVMLALAVGLSVRDI